MKTKVFFASIVFSLFVGLIATSQTITIFSEKGEKFTAYVNGSPRMNAPATRVETDRPGGPSFKIRIAFEDSSIPEISKTIFNTPSTEMFYVIRLSKGKMILEKTSSEYVHHDEAAPATEKKTMKKEEPKPKEAPKSEPKAEGKKTHYCSNPMDDVDFEASKHVIANAPFDGPRLSHAKSLAEKKCLTTDQIISVMSVFSGDGTRLKFAKFAYKLCYDPYNYDKVKDTLSASDRDELQHYINMQ